MSFISETYNVLIASASDLSEERQIAIQSVTEWNVQHADAESVVLLPVTWETYAMPQIAVRPQEAINRQLVSKSDILVGMFWTKIGTSTGAAESGTVEEIDQFVAAGKPAMLYFSSRPISPNKIDLRQHDKLNNFREETYRGALVGGFSDLNELREVLLRDLMRQVRQIKLGRLNHPKWDKSANLFWLGYDLMWTLQISLRAFPKTEILRGLKSSTHHLKSLNLASTAPGQRLAKLLEKVQAKDFQWDSHQRELLADELDTVSAEVGKLAAVNQPDFE